MMREPLTVLAEVYDAAGIELTGVTVANVQAWLDANPKGAGGHHAYDLGDYGLDPDDIRSRFVSGYESSPQRALRGSSVVNSSRPARRSASSAAMIALKCSPVPPGRPTSLLIANARYRAVRSASPWQRRSTRRKSDRSGE